MDLSILLSWQLVLVCMILYMFTFVFRRALEGHFPSLKQNIKWRKLYLGLLPVFFGIIFGLISFPFPWPVELASMFNRTMTSMVCGMFSGWVYARIRGAITAGKVKIPGLGELPPAEIIEEDVVVDEEVKD